MSFPLQIVLCFILTAFLTLFLLCLSNLATIWQGNYFLFVSVWSSKCQLLLDIQPPTHKQPSHLRKLLLQLHWMFFIPPVYILAPIHRWEVVKGEILEVHGASNMAYAVVNKKTHLKQGEKTNTWGCLLTSKCQLCHTCAWVCILYLYLSVCVSFCLFLSQKYPLQNTNTYVYIHILFISK